MCVLGALRTSTEKTLKESCPSIQSPESDLQRRLIFNHTSRRPADKSQPAIELFESTSLVLYLRFSRSRWDPASSRHELQRPSRFEVALVSRVSCFRARGLKSFAIASSYAFTEVLTFSDELPRLAGYIFSIDRNLWRSPIDQVVRVRPA